MHDIDRTLADMGEEYEFDDEAEFEEYEYEFDDEGDFDDEYGYEMEDGGVFDEEEEYDLAAELLSSSDDEELEYFLGKLIKKAARKVRKAVKSPVGRALRGGLRKLAKRALPIAGGAAGSAFGGPMGGLIGGNVGGGIGKLFGLELEGLSGEDQEFEVARRVVRLAGAASKNAATQRSSGDADRDAMKAVAKAAKTHAPGLLSPAKRPSGPMMAGAVSGHTGRWVRRGRKIVLTGV